MSPKRAEEILGDAARESGRLRTLDHEYLHWDPGNGTACLDGNFTADQLEAIAVHMRARST